MHEQLRQTPPDMPPMQPSGEAKADQLRLAREQGDALGRALDHMIHKEAHGAEKRAGEYLVAYAVEKAEGLYALRNGTLEWQQPQDENTHIEVAVRDGSDGRFVPGLTVYATLFDSAGQQVGRHQLPFLWHPWLYHYGLDWRVPGSGLYTLQIHIDVPDFMRHDKTNGKRFAHPVDVEFTGVRIDTGQKIS